MPKELYASSPGEVAYREVDDPVLESNQVRVKAEFGAFKHGTELTMFRNTSAFAHARIHPEMGIFVEDPDAAWGPVGLGNMIVGRVAEVGPDVTGLAVGDRVCGHSTMRDTTVWNADAAWKIGEDVDWTAAVCLDPAEFAFAAVRDGNVRIGDDVAVFGLGAIGLFIVQLARLSGARRVVGVDPVPARRQLARDFGANLAIDPVNDDPGRRIKEFLDSKGADVALETSGNYSALHHAIRGLDFGGNAVAVAWPKECKGGLDFGQEAHFNRPNLIFARACSEPNRDYPRWSEKRILDTLKIWLADGILKAGGMVTPVVPFDQAADAWLKVDSDPTFSVKLGVAF